MRTQITRIRDNGRLTMGRLAIFEGQMLQYQCVTLEPSYVLNQPYISCIPTGKFTLKRRRSKKFGAHLHITGVPNRDYILIHTLNYFKQSEGCMGVGQRFKYLNSDNEIDITDSRKTLNSLLNMVPDESTIQISNHKKFQRFYNQNDDMTFLMEGVFGDQDGEWNNKPNYR